MDKFISDIDSCYHKISEKPISKISSSAIFLAYNYIQTAPQSEKKTLIIGIPFKGNLGLILSAGLLKNFFNEDYLLHSDEHFRKLQLEDGDQIKIFGMLTSWFSSRSHKNGFIELKQTTYGAFGEKDTSLITRNIKNEWLPYIEKIGGKTKRVISFHTFYKRIKKHRVQRTALDDFLEYNESGFGIPSQALFSKVILVSGRGRKAKTIRSLKDNHVYGDSLYNILVKNHGLEVFPDLKSFTDCFAPDSAQKFRNFVSYAKKIFEFVPEFDSSELLELLLRSDIHSESFANKMEEFESYADDNELLIVQNHLNKLKKVYPQKQKNVPENLKCIIIEDPIIFNEYQNTVHGFLERNIPIIVLKSLSDDYINDSLIGGVYRFYFSKKKIRCLINVSERGVYDEEILNMNENFLKQTLEIEIFNDQNFENLILNLAKFFFDVEGFEDLKKTYWRIVYPVSFLFKNSLQSKFSDYRTILHPFFESFNRVRNQLPIKIIELIDFLRSHDWENNKEVKKNGYGFNQVLTISNQTYGYHFQKCLIKTNRLKNTYQSITFTGIPYKEYYQNNIIKALFKYFIPEINLLLFNKEHHKIKAQIEQFLVQHYFEDNVPFTQGIHPDYFFSKTQIEQEISNLFSIKGFKTEDVEIDIVSDELHQRIIAAKSKDFAAKTNEDHVVNCIVIYFSNEEWMFIPKDSKHYIASEEDDEVITISKLPVSQIKKNDLLILYNLDVSQLTFLASNNRPLKNSLAKLEVWRNIILDYLHENSLKDLSNELENAKTKEESNANPSIQNLRTWCNDEDLISPIRENLSLILRFAGKQEKLDNIYQARKNVISFRNSIRREIQKKLKTKLPKILLEKNPNSEFKIKIYGVDVEIKTREVSFIDEEVIQVTYHNTKKIMRD